MSKAQLRSLLAANAARSQLCPNQGFSLFATCGNNNDGTYAYILQREAKLDGVTVDYIPTHQIRRLYNQLQPGDIVAVATNIPGLDVTHTGLAYRHPNGNIGLIHASPIGKVTTAPDLETYVGKIKNAIGILVARPIDPRYRDGVISNPGKLATLFMMNKTQ